MCLLAPRMICYLGKAISPYYSTFWYKKVLSRWQQCYTFREPAQGFLLPTHSPDPARMQLNNQLESLSSPDWTWQTAASHRFFLLGKLSGRGQACFCSLHCRVRAPKVKSRAWQQAKEQALVQFTYAAISTVLLSIFSTFFHCPSHYLVNLLLPSAFTILPSVFST